MQPAVTAECSVRSVTGGRAGRAWPRAGHIGPGRPTAPPRPPGLRCLHRGLRELEAAAEPVRPAAVSACCFWEKSPTGDALRPGTTPGPGSPELASSSPSGSRQPAPPSALYSASDAWPVPRLPHTERRHRERHVLIANRRPGKRARRRLSAESGARGDAAPRTAAPGRAPVCAHRQNVRGVTLGAEKPHATARARGGAPRSAEAQRSGRGLTLVPTCRRNGTRH